ncbi:hypothetical protein NFI96_018250, partial [Prochilodus magdalenae]
MLACWASIQCEDDPEGQNGRVIIDNRSYSLQPLNADTDDGVVPEVHQEEDLMREDGHHSSAHYGTHGGSPAVQVSVQCVDDPEGRHGCIVFDNMSYSLPRLNTHAGSVVSETRLEEDLMVGDGHQCSAHYGRRGDATAVQV